MLRTRKLYEEDAYQSSCSASVLRVSRAEDGNAEHTGLWEIVLDQTVFFPEGGGQSADRGWIIPSGEETWEPAVVVDVRIVGDEIVHFVKPSGEGARTDGAQAFGAGQGDTRLPGEGDAVTASIDWGRRFGFMQNHTGEHILSGIMHARYGYDNVGFHLSDNTVTLDVSGPLSREQIIDVEWEANEAVYRNLPVMISYPDDAALAALSYRSKKEIEGQVRIVTIPDVDVCACCAPHVRHTGEIGIIKIVRAIRWGDGMRLTIESGGRAFSTIQKGQLVLEEISHLTNRSREESAEGVQHLLSEIEAYKERVKALSYEAAFLRLQALPTDAVNAFVFAQEMDAIVQRNLVNRLTEEHTGVCGVFVGDDENGYRYIIGSGNEDVREIQTLLREKCGAKGGGKPVMVQGSVKADEKALRGILPA